MREGGIEGGRVKDVKRERRKRGILIDAYEFIISCVCIWDLMKAMYSGSVPYGNMTAMLSNKHTTLKS